jgi:hypothetical protein
MHSQKLFISFNQYIQVSYICKNSCNKQFLYFNFTLQVSVISWLDIYLGSIKAEKWKVKFLSNKLKEFTVIKFHIVSQVTVFDRSYTGVLSSIKNLYAAMYIPLYPNTCKLQSASQVIGFYFEGCWYNCSGFIATNF